MKLTKAQRFDEDAKALEDEARTCRNRIQRQMLLDQATDLRADAAVTRIFERLCSKPTALARDTEQSR